MYAEEIKFDRQSICMADDVTAPNESVIEVTERDALMDVMVKVAAYLPQIGDSVWAVDSGREVIAYILLDGRVISATSRKCLRRIVMFRYVHTNIIAKDYQKLINFYKEVFHCKSIGETRDLRGEWLDRLTGIPNAHLVGEHLCLPGYEQDHPTLEIFSYDAMEDPRIMINKCGIAHMAFEVDDVEETLQILLQNGGSQIGELIKTTYENGKKATFVYATDCEGNIIEIQSWS